MQNGLNRRDWLRAGLGTAMGLSAAGQGRANQAAPALEAGEGVVEITPPPGVELAGFHRAAGNERRATGTRQATFARALVLRRQATAVALVSLDIIGVSRDFTRRVQDRVAKEVGIPAAHVRVCCTHTHSMPCFRYLRQWGAIPQQYMAEVESKIVQAVGLAQADLAPAEMFVGQERVVGGNFNRTVSSWKTDRDFGKESTAAERWLDTTLHAVRFDRGAGKRTLVWYHFSSHPVCYTDGNSGPDWPGLVLTKAEAADKLSPAFLQGHAGDVNPGDGKPWLGDPERTATAVYTGLRQALDKARRVTVDRLAIVSTDVDLPLDIPLLSEQLARYRKDPSQCASGEWVDAGFAKDWAEGIAKWNLQQTTLPVPASALRVGDVLWLFHPAELYSYYGLAIRRDSPCADTLVVGYADDIIGYLPDPAAYQRREYAAVVVPKLLDLPPFTPNAAGELVRALGQLAQRPG